jgi:hypothetical protein
VRPSRPTTTRSPGGSAALPKAAERCGGLVDVFTDGPRMS